MTRACSSIVGLVVIALGLSVGCGSEVPAPAETDPGVVIDTVALTVEGMT